MVIRVNDRLRFERSLGGGWMLIVGEDAMTQPRDGSPSEPTIAEARYYYGNLAHAAVAALEKDAVGLSAGELGTFIEELRRSREEIVRAIAAAGLGR